MINTNEYCAVYLDVGIMLYVEDGDDVDGDEGAADDVHGHDQAVQVPKAGQESVHHQGEQETDEAENAPKGVENWVGCALIPIVPVGVGEIVKMGYQ